MKKSLTKNAVKFMQNPNNEYLCDNATPAQSDYVRSTACGGGALN
ncbi:MAG: hypothetical protein ACLSWI_05745 [Candidatus Gastranaerophilaceae bacterium]